MTKAQMYTGLRTVVVERGGGNLLKKKRVRQGRSDVSAYTFAEVCVCACVCVRARAQPRENRSGDVFNSSRLTEEMDRRFYPKAGRSGRAGAKAKAAVTAPGTKSTLLICASPSTPPFLCADFTPLLDFF